MIRYLSNRPTGVRRSWRKAEPDLAELGARLREICPLVKEDWGDPIEGQEFFERKGPLRRIVALYGNYKRVSISYRRDGWRIKMDSVQQW